MEGRRDGRPGLTAQVADKSFERYVGQRVKVQADGCWIYRGRVDKYGCVGVRHDGRLFRVRVHRFVYETLVGPIPDDYHLHHNCETPGCCNPAHVEPLTAGDHMRWHVARRRGL